jgi:hypothetical protein
LGTALVTPLKDNIPTGEDGLASNYKLTGYQAAWSASILEEVLMYTVSRRSLSVGFSIAAALAALLIVPTASQAQAAGNTATGLYTLHFDTTGAYNTADGYTALYYNTTGNGNTGSGAYALAYNTSGTANSAFGYAALSKNMTGDYNTATGYTSLVANTTGKANTADGYDTLNKTSTGSYNTAIGTNSLFENTTASANTGIGYETLYYNTTGDSNTAVGHGALSANVTGSGNIALGYGAGASIYNESNNIDIGNEGKGADAGVIRIGTTLSQTATFIAGINGVNASGGVEVYINSNGQLGTLKSSRRFKFDIKDIGAQSDRLMDLRPVAFRYKEAAEDGTHPIQYGLIAEEVAKVYPDLVQYDKQGKPFTVYYHLLTPMMLNELQKAQQQLAAQQTEISALKCGQNQTAGLQTQVNALQHANQLQFMIFGAFALVVTAFVLVFAVYAAAGRIRRSTSWRARQIETCAS